MRNLMLLTVISLTLSACIANQPQQQVQWDNITSASTVASVQGIKSLIPGVY